MQNTLVHSRAPKSLLPSLHQLEVRITSSKLSPGEERMPRGSYWRSAPWVHSHDLWNWWKAVCPLPLQQTVVNRHRHRIAALIFLFKKGETGSRKESVVHGDSKIQSTSCNPLSSPLIASQDLGIILPWSLTPSPNPWFCLPVKLPSLQEVMHLCSVFLTPVHKDFSYAFF